VKRYGYSSSFNGSQFKQHTESGQHQDYEQQSAANMLNVIQQVPKMAPGAIGSRMDILA
jgi:hypothetical protein